MIRFKVGQKVVCIDDSEGYSSGTKTLVKNKIYSVIGIRRETGGVMLKEVIAPINSSGYYSPWRFRQLDETYAQNLLSKLTAEHLQEEKIRKEIERQSLKQKLFELTNPVDNPPAKN